MAAAPDETQGVGVDIQNPIELLFHSLSSPAPAKFRAGPEISPDGLSVAVGIDKEVTVFGSANLDVRNLPLTLLYKVPPASITGDLPNCKANNCDCMSTLVTCRVIDACTRGFFAGAVVV